MTIIAAAAAAIARHRNFLAASFRAQVLDYLPSYFQISLFE